MEKKFWKKRRPPPPQEKDIQIDLAQYSPEFNSEILAALNSRLDTEEQRPIMVMKFFCLQLQKLLDLSDSNITQQTKEGRVFPFLTTFLSCFPIISSASAIHPNKNPAVAILVKDLCAYVLVLFLRLTRLSRASDKNEMNWRELWFAQLRPSHMLGFCKLYGPTNPDLVREAISSNLFVLEPRLVPCLNRTISAIVNYYKEVVAALSKRQAHDHEKMPAAEIPQDPAALTQVFLDITARVRHLATFFPVPVAQFMVTDCKVHAMLAGIRAEMRRCLKLYQGVLKDKSVAETAISNCDAGVVELYISSGATENREILAGIVLELSGLAIPREFVIQPIDLGYAALLKVLTRSDKAAVRKDAERIKAGADTMRIIDAAMAKGYKGLRELISSQQKANSKSEIKKGEEKQHDEDKLVAKEERADGFYDFRYYV